ncbi:complement resistance protein TraT [Thalassotalea maritima]|uniref:complement resistance protein TraT n=1 Tax=Thalassotalea maritima TaxID=3242416 RepID=UPI00352852D3
MSIKRITSGIVMTVVLLLSGCAALHTSIDKNELDVQTHMSASIMLTPVSSEQRTVFLQLKNTSDKQFDYYGPVRDAIIKKGYRVVDDPELAHYWLQANILQVNRQDLRELEGHVNHAYNAAIEGAEFGSLFGDGDGETAAMIVGGLLGVVIDALVSDVVYVMITDLQVSEKVSSDVTIEESNQTQIQQGTSGDVEQSSVEISERRKYQTRVTSTANQVNLTFEEAQQQLLQGLVRSVSGIL